MCSGGWLRPRHSLAPIAILFSTEVLTVTHPSKHSSVFCEVEQMSERLNEINVKLSSLVNMILFLSRGVTYT